MKSKKNINKTNDLLLKKLTFSDFNNCNSYIINNKINIDNFIKYLLENSKKSSKTGQILPAVVFLIISLVSFSVLFFSSNLAKYWVLLENENIKISIFLFGLLFLILAIVLIIQRYIFKVKIVYIYTGYNKGYKNINNKKYNEMLFYLINKKKENEV